MKVLYINPPKIASGLDSVIKGAPLSLMSIAAMVPDHEAKLIDFKVDKFRKEAFLKELNRTDIVAITSMTPQIYSAFDVARMAKQQGCTTIIGGYHATLAPYHVIKNDNVDFIIRNEGEHTFKELIDFLDGNRKNVTLKEILGISYKDSDGKVLHNPERLLEKNLDVFPLPNRELIKGKKYIYLGVKLDLMESSRGCPHNCKFCCITALNRNRYRVKSLPRVMKEIYSIDRSNDFLFMCEDNFTINVKRTKKILETMIKSGIQHHIYSSCQSRIDTLYQNSWLIPLMEKAGMRQVFLGIESVHQQSLDAMNKRNTTPAMTKEVVRMLQDHGISIFGGVVLGFPGETKTMVRQTINYIKSLELDCVQFTPITAYPGTDFYEEMKKEGKITSYNFKHYNLFHTMMGTNELTNRELYRLVAEAYASYYFDKSWFIKMGKRYLNPFSKYNWMTKHLPMFIKTVVQEAQKMFASQGIGYSAVSDELKQMVKDSKKRDQIVYSEHKPEIELFSEPQKNPIYYEVVEKVTT